MNNNLNLRDYILNQMGRNHLIQEIDKRQYFARNMKVLLQKHVKDFLSKKSEERWIIIPGLRGVGKTTLVAQVYQWVYQQWVRDKTEAEKLNIIYMSLDVVNNLGGDLMSSLNIYESLLTNRFENTDQPVFIFIDEVQVDPNWAKVLKTIYDRTSNVFMICTGSAATYLQMDADIAGRRAIIERLYPLSFTEYQMLSLRQLPTKGLKQQLMDIFYYSTSASEVYEKLEKIRGSLDQAWSKYDPHQIEKYLQSGTMPFAVNRSQASIDQALIDNINKIVSSDLVIDRRFNFSYSSIETIKQLLILLAGSSSTPSLSALKDTLGVDTKNLLEMLQALVKAEVLIRIPAYGGTFATVRQPVNYQFMSAALRNSYWNITGNARTAESRRGQLMEDVAALHYYREFNTRSKGIVNYIYSKNKAIDCDFILKVANQRQIAIEFGLGKKTDKQVQTTMTNINCDYGLVFSNADLELRQNIVLIPLRYFFLV